MQIDTHSQSHTANMNNKVLYNWVKIKVWYLIS